MLDYPKDKMKNKDGSISKRYQAQLDKGAHFYDELDAEGDPAIAKCEVKQCAWGYFEYPEFNLGSRQQIAKYLQHFGWKPKAFTEKGNPIVDEGRFQCLPSCFHCHLSKYYILVFRFCA